MSCWWFSGFVMCVDGFVLRIEAFLCVFSGCCVVFCMVNGGLKVLTSVALILWIVPRVPGKCACFFFQQKGSQKENMLTKLVGLRWDMLRESSILQSFQAAQTIFSWMWRGILGRSVCRGQGTCTRPCNEGEVPGEWVQGFPKKEARSGWLWKGGLMIS